MSGEHNLKIIQSFDSDIKRDYIGEASSPGGVTDVKLNGIKEERLNSPRSEVCKAIVKSETYEFSIKQEEDDIIVKLEPPSHEESNTESKALGACTSEQAYIQYATCDEHKIEKPFVCIVCKKNFMYKASLLSHARFHMEDNPYKCYTCTQTFPTAKSLTQHLNIHFEVDPFACNEKLPLGSSLISHIRVDTPYTCKTCNAIFSKAESLKEHMNIHLGITPYECKLCYQKYARKCDLMSHSVVHTGEKLYSYLVHGQFHLARTLCECKVCSEKFNRTST